MKKVICDIYRSNKKEGLYLYVPKLKGLTKVPEALLAMFGTPSLAFSTVLTLEKKLIKEDIEKVLDALDTQGYFLQLPPASEDDYMQVVNQHNSKLAK